MHHSNKACREHSITACRPINTSIWLLLITEVVTFKLSSGAKWVPVALYETYITESKEQRDGFKRLLQKRSSQELWRCVNFIYHSGPVNSPLNNWSFVFDPVARAFFMSVDWAEREAAPVLLQHLPLVLIGSVRLSSVFGNRARIKKKKKRKCYRTIVLRLLTLRHGLYSHLPLLITLYIHFKMQCKVFWFQWGYTSDFTCFLYVFAV